MKEQLNLAMAEIVPDLTPFHEVTLLVSFEVDFENKKCPAHFFFF